MPVALMSPPHHQPLVIACGADDQYVQPLAVMLESALTNLSSDRGVDLYIIDGGIEPSHKRDLVSSWNRNSVSLHWLSPRESSFSGLPLWGRMPIATYYKLLIPEMLPATVHKAIWLDCDLVVTADLAWLWDNDLGGRHALAVQDPAVPFVSSRNGVADHEQLGIAREAKYFNAGVMLVDLDLWRQDHIPARVIEYLRVHRDSVVFWDQEGLNAVLAGNWGELDPRWNYSANIRRRRTRAGNGGVSKKEPSNEPWIIHFTGNLKPWVYPGSSKSDAIYFRYLDATAWAGWRPKRTLSRTVLELYGSSGLRDVLYPGEEWLMRLLRTLTRRYAADKPGHEQ
jgi:lipopolysaccharide biosynthesis glycosyltransferase